MSEIAKFDNEQRVAAFIESLRKHIGGGGHMVPFVGSGISVASGFPLLAQLASRELPYWVLRALGLNPWATGIGDWDEKELRLFDPRSAAWPDMAAETARRGPFDLEQARRVLKYTLEACEAAPQPDGARRFFPAIVREALAVLQRETGETDGAAGDGGGGAEDGKDLKAGEALDIIEFLSRIEWRRPPGFMRGEIVMELGSRDDSVADHLFSIHLSRRRQPALVHRMLQALAPACRCHVLLTTNFDTLTEAAFAAADMPLDVFDVPQSAHLPEAELVLAQRSLVKLHGGRFDLRTDGTIDVPADQKDIENFLSYLAGYRIRLRDLPLGGMAGKIAIVAAGLSGRDRRTQSLLWAAWQYFHDLKIYWLSYDEPPPPFLKSLISRENSMPVVERLAHPDHGLFFLQLYQTLDHTLPTSGVIFPGLWQLPAPPLIPPPPTGGAHAAHYEAARENLEGWFKRQCAAGNREPRKPLLLWVEGSDRGGMPLCADLFSDNRWQRSLAARCLWMDLDEIAEPVGVLLRLVLMAAKTEGETDPISTLDLRAFAEPNDVERSSRIQGVRRAVRSVLARIHGRTGRRLIVFLNGQEGLGWASPFKLAPAPRTGGWDDSNARDELLRLILELNEDPRDGVQFVLLFREDSSDASNDALHHFCETLREADQLAIRLKRDSASFDKITIKPCCSFDPVADGARAIDGWMSERKSALDEFRPVFLCLLILFRHARFPSSLVRILAEYREETKGHAGWTIKDIGKTVGNWLGTLEENRVLRRKVGGFIWMNNRLRETLAARLRETWPSDLEPWPSALLRLGALTARWHGRLLLASADPLAAAEGAHHALASIKHWLEEPRSHFDPVETAHAGVMIRHAQLLLRCARGLFERRLSGQFAERALEVLQTEAEQTVSLMYFRVSGTDAFIAALALLIEIVRIRAVVALREGAYDRVLALEHRPTGLDRAAGQALATHQEWPHSLAELRLNSAGALLYLRRYEPAAEILRRLWQEHGLPGACCPELYRPIAPQDHRGFQVAREWLAGHGSTQRAAREPHDRRLVARIARWWLYLLLISSQVHYLVSRSTSGTSDGTGAARRPLDRRRKQRRESLELALWFYDFAVEILRSIPETDDGFVFEENVRLRAHAALCRGILEAETGQVTMPRALMLLSDARAYTEDFPLKEGGVNSVILHLRRAELQLIRVGQKRWLGDFRERLRQWIPESNAVGLPQLPRDMGRTEVNLDDLSQEGLTVKEEMFELVTLVHDSLSHLLRAEDELRSHPKSRWWWSIFAVLKMKACEYLYTLRLARARLAEAENDETFEDRERRFVPFDAGAFFGGEVLDLVRVRGINDVFYLSRLFHSHARTIRAQYGYYLVRTATERSGHQEEKSKRAARIFATRCGDLFGIIDPAIRALAPLRENAGPPHGLENAPPDGTNKSGEYRLPVDRLVYQYFLECYQDVVGMLPVDGRLLAAIKETLPPVESEDAPSASPEAGDLRRPGGIESARGNSLQHRRESPPVDSSSPAGD